MATTPGRATVLRALIIEREYEPSRMTRKVMANSYEILVPVASASLRRQRRVASDKETGRQWEGSVATGGQW
jgi:hypothetical protein